MDTPEPYFRNTAVGVAYTGSKTCAECHAEIYKEYGKTAHGQSASLPAERPELQQLPPSGVTICQKDLPNCFRVFPRDGSYYVSEFRPGPGDTRLFEDTQKIAYALGKPMVGTGYAIQRGNYLFEAPLSYYAGNQDIHPEGWALAPGYDRDPLGLVRPLVGSCLYCHAGRLRPTSDASNLYRSPIFGELSIGCENCHGPGALHVAERRQNLPIRGQLDTSIVNPVYLAPHLADDTCITCHELGEARVPMPGKSFSDYRPGEPLLETSAIFKTRLVMGWNMEEWYDEMRLSKCFRASDGRLSCITCHDPHRSLSAEEAPAWYRSRCLTCHKESSCRAPLQARQSTTPLDNCIGCHMPRHVAPSFVMPGTEGTRPE